MYFVVLDSSSLKYSVYDKHSAPFSTLDTFSLFTLDLHNWWPPPLLSHHDSYWNIISQIQAKYTSITSIFHLRPGVFTSIEISPFITLHKAGSAFILLDYKLSFTYRKALNLLTF